MPELMKGATWKARRNKVQFPLIAEIKEDEIRCHVRLFPDKGAVLFMSYAGKALLNLDRFAQVFLAAGYLAGRTEFDTGVIVNKSFNDTYRYVRSKTVPDDLVNAEVSFILFDLPESSGTYIERREEMKKLLTTPGIHLPYLRAPWATHVVDEEHVKYLFERVREQGFEGLMLKEPGHLYERKRSNSWMKYKPSEDADGVIVALHEAVSDTDDVEKGLYKGKPLGRIGSVTLRMEDGSEATPHGIAHDLGRAMYLDPQKYLHQWAEMTYMERDRQGGYRHPVFNRLREAKA